MIRTLVSDVRYALRVLWRAPAFSLAVIAVLALGIGANTAIFSIVNTVLLRPLPFDESRDLVRVFHEPPQTAFPGIHRFAVSPANFYDWQRDARSFDGMAIYRFRQFALTGDANAESVVAGAVGTDFFALLRTAPRLGRVFLPEEDTPARGHVAVLSDAFWKTHFGSAPDVVGRTLTLDGEAYTIVGVMPPQFSVRSWAVTAQPLWVPLAYTDTERAVRDNHNAQVVARLKPGVSPTQAQKEMDVVSARLEQAYPKENTGWGATVVPLDDVVVGDIRTSLVMLFAAVGLVLLVACANVGNLLFARALARRKELAIRSALGAGRARVFQQLLVETLTLALAGGGAGLMLAGASLAAGSRLLIDQVPRADEIAIDARVLVFVLAVSILTGVLAGVLPAFRAGRTDVNSALKEGGRSDGTVGVRVRRALIVCEVALSLVLLMGAAVMVRSLLALRHVDAGFDPRGVLTMRVSPPDTRYNTADKFLSFVDRALQGVRALPGVESAGAIDDLPVLGGSVQPIVLEGRAELLPRDQPTVAVRRITRDYLKTMRIPILAGRDVADGDSEVMLVSRSAAQLLFGDDDPIGRRVTLPLEAKGVLRQVIGVVGDVKQGELSEGTSATVYEFTRQFGWGGVTIVMRTAVPPLSLSRAASGVIRALDPQQPVEDVQTMEAVLNETLTSQRFSALLLGLFAAVALTLASVGIYSVLSYIVRGRSREIAVRTALGARTSDVLRLVIFEGMTPAVIGIAAGAVAALAAARILSRLVYGVSASDPVTLMAVAGTLALVAFLASLIPAYRASRLDPLVILRAS
jgi:predicted permease